MKSSGAASTTWEHVSTGFASVRSWCVRPSYRTELVQPGHRVLLWISGNGPEPSGLYAVGRTTGPVSDDQLPVRLTPVRVPVLRSELLAHPVLAAMEVLRMPAGSNPSFVTAAQLEALVELGLPPR